MNMTERTQRNAERFQRLAEVRSGTPMGELLRRFWHPIALSREVVSDRGKEVMLLGEELAIYRGASGTPYLVSNCCAHRRTKLHTGWIEGESIRCMYHGWKFSGSGQCEERPAERPGSEKSIRIGAYPLKEYCGVVFAYLGKGDPPEFDLPRREAFEKPGALIFSRKEIWECHWLQHVENSLDAVHVSFAHQKGIVGSFGQNITTEVPSVSSVETEAGICQTAEREKHIRVSDWTMPNCNHVALPGPRPEDPWSEVSHWMVPLDERRTMRLAVIAMPSTTPERDAELTQYFTEVADYKAADHHDDLFKGIYPSDPLVQLTSAQDYVALIGQGVVADRANEILGSSDVAIALLRRILMREMDALESDGPAKQWRRLGKGPALFTRTNAAQTTA